MDTQTAGSPATPANPVLLGRDYVFLLDKSSSMSGTDGLTRTRWQRGQELVLGIAREAIKYDPDGISVVPFNGDFTVYQNVDGGDEIIAKIFSENSPQGSTDTTKALKNVLDGYFADANRKPMTIIVATDGETSDKNSLKALIIDAANRINKDEDLAIQFLQIGHDKAAAAFLTDLDDHLKGVGCKFDIVDFKTEADLEKLTIEQLLIQAITD